MVAPHVNPRLLLNTAKIYDRDGEAIYYGGPHELWKIAGGPQNLINFYLHILRLFSCMSRERDASLSLLSRCLLVLEFHFDAMLCSILGNENYDAVQ